MINKYTIDLKQFNGGEIDRITFPVFEQCLMYGMHKLKNACADGTSVLQAFLIEDSQGRRFVVNPSLEELQTMELSTMSGSSGIKLKIKRDPFDGEGRFTFK